MPGDGTVAYQHPFTNQNLLAFGLDFDDAYQYAATEKYDVALVSFDGDFDHTERGRITPRKIVEAE